MWKVTGGATDALKINHTVFFYTHIYIPNLHVQVVVVYVAVSRGLRCASLVRGNTGYYSRADSIQSSIFTFIFSSTRFSWQICFAGYPAFQSQQWLSTRSFLEYIRTQVKYAVISQRRACNTLVIRRYIPYRLFRCRSYDVRSTGRVTS